MVNEEKSRLLAARFDGVPWRRWGPYVSERQWGTVREDESPSGDAWNYLSHDAARARAYRWGEDGLAGISDDRQLLCFALAFWNGKDPILKERLFGLTNGQGNHGEDVKEYYFYLDSTPTHSFMSYLYKYPQRAYPYQRLIDENGRRSRRELEYELLDTGVFEDDRYFDVFVCYAKASPEDLLLPAESDSGMFGGNSNWRGPIWIPINGLLIRALLNYYAYYGNEFVVECPTGSGRRLDLYQVARELTFRLARIFTLDEHGRRPVHGGAEKFRDDPLWRDHILFYEYFHGDIGAGIGASHQTGWTGLVAGLMTFFARNSAEQVLDAGDLRERLQQTHAPHPIAVQGG